MISHRATTSFPFLPISFPTFHRRNVSGPSSTRWPSSSRPAAFYLKLPNLTYRHIHALTRRHFIYCRGSLNNSQQQQQPDYHNGNSNKLILTYSALTVALAVANRVLYKLALVPMKHYPFFLAQFTTFGYVVIYFSILYARYKAGIVTDEMIRVPKSRFVAIGVLEALGVAAGMAAAAMLPGPSIPILSQTFLVWQLAFSTLLLGRRYSFNQIFACFLVATGVVVAVASGSKENQMLSGAKLIWSAVMIVSSAFQAGASIIKESIFVDAAKHLKGKSLDIFVVNSFGSGYQALLVLLFLPFLSNMKGIRFAELPSYLRSGAGCLINSGANTPGCDGAPLLPLLFVATNMAFNISLLNLVKSSSAVVSSLAVMLSVPISIYCLSLPLPYLPEGTSLSPFFMVGCAVLLLGLFIYNVAGQPSRSQSSGSAPRSTTMSPRNTSSFVLVSFDARKRTCKAIRWMV